MENEREKRMCTTFLFFFVIARCYKSNKRNGKYYNINIHHFVLILYLNIILYSYLLSTNKKIYNGMSYSTMLCSVYTSIAGEYEDHVFTERILSGFYSK